jgi:glycosyltransferase involved in cell wall biosynthesis
LLAGKPILMDCQGPAAQIVTDAGAGICFTSENATEFAAAVERMAAMSVAEREALGDRGSRYYWNHLSLQAGANAMSDLFSSVLAGKPPFSSAFTTSERPAAHAGAA